MNVHTTVLASLCLLLAACGAPSSLESGEFRAGEEEDPALTGATLSIDADAATGVVTLQSGDTFSFTLRELPESEWLEVGTYPFTQGTARTYALAPDPLILSPRSTFQAPRLVPLNGGQDVLLVGNSGEAEQHLYFLRP